VTKAAEACVEGSAVWDRKAQQNREDDKTKKDAGPPPGTPRESNDSGGPKVEIVRAPGADEHDKLRTSTQQYQA
jgi:hypothetical protein